MTRYVTSASCLLLASLLSVGCGNGENQPVVAGIGSSSAAEKSKYLLVEEPTGVKSIMELRKEAKDGDEVVVAGRIGGSKEPMIKGRAAFTVVDVTIEPCMEEGDDCPWDYCCTAPEDLAQGMTLVKIVDEQGKPLAVDARELLGVKELQTVVVRGKAKRDEAGNLTILAKGLFVKS